MTARRLAWVAVVAACSSSSRRAPPVANAPAEQSPPPVDSEDTPVPAADSDCVLELEAISGKLDHKAPGVRTIAAPVRRDRRVTEELALADGTHVKFSLGGCAHYGWDLTYTLPAGSVGADPEQRLDTAATLLGKTPMTDDSASDMARRIRARPRPKTPRAARGRWPIECGDAVCEVDVERDARSLRIRVSYDFPL